MITMTIRYPFLFLFWITGKRTLLFERANYTAIGWTGHVSSLDDAVAKDHKLKPLNRFEQWLLKPMINEEKKYRQEALKQTLRDYGEDPDSNEP